MVKLILASAFILSASAAFSADAKGPCERGDSTVKLGDFDLDDMRCQMAITQQNLGAMAYQLLSMQAKYALLQSDLAAATKRADELQKQVNDLKKRDGSQTP